MERESREETGFDGVEGQIGRDGEREKEETGSMG